MHPKTQITSKPNLSYKPAFTETVESKAIARYVLKFLSIRAEKEHLDHEVSYKRSFTETAEQTGTLLWPARDHVHTCGNSFNTFIIVIKIKFITIFIVNIIHIIINATCRMNVLTHKERPRCQEVSPTSQFVFLSPRKIFSHCFTFLVR